tara:strand:- start:551 stop:1117 length:567 start_codon:yes stop_codon:yes gene_type:complete
MGFCIKREPVKPIRERIGGQYISVPYGISDFDGTTLQDLIDAVNKAALKHNENVNSGVNLQSSPHGDNLVQVPVAPEDVRFTVSYDYDESFVQCYIDASISDEAWALIIKDYEEKHKEWEQWTRDHADEIAEELERREQAKRQRKIDDEAAKVRDAELRLEAKRLALRNHQQEAERLEKELKEAGELD